MCATEEENALQESKHTDRNTDRQQAKAHLSRRKERTTTTKQQKRAKLNQLNSISVCLNTHTHCDTTSPRYLAEGQKEKERDREPGKKRNRKG